MEETRTPEVSHPREVIDRVKIILLVTLLVILVIAIGCLIMNRTTSTSTIISGADLYKYI